MNAEKQYDKIAEALADDGAAKSQMFGMPTMKVGGKAFAGIRNGEMVFKLTGEAHARALAMKGAHLFDPMDGRPMKEWVVVPATGAKEWQSLAKDALEYVSSVKKPSPKKKK
jgi:hypothetical protein